MTTSNNAAPQPQKPGAELSLYLRDQGHELIFACLDVRCKRVKPRSVAVKSRSVAGLAVIRKRDTPSAPSLFKSISDYCLNELPAIAAFVACLQLSSNELQRRRIISFSPKATHQLPKACQPCSYAVHRRAAAAAAPRSSHAPAYSAPCNAPSSQPQKPGAELSLNLRDQGQISSRARCGVASQITTRIAWAAYSARPRWPPPRPR